MSRRNYPRRRQWTRGTGKARKLRLNENKQRSARARTMPPMPPKTRCGKVGYRDEAEAKLWLKWITTRRRDRDGARVEKRAYECNRCHKWHLTHQEQRTG